MLPISQNDIKKCAIPQKSGEFGSNRHYQVHNSDVMVHHEHTAHMVSDFDTKEDGNYYFDEDAVEIKGGLNLAIYFMAKSASRRMFSMPFTVIKCLYRELNAWLQGSPCKDYEMVEFEYTTDVKEKKTYYSMTLPGSVGKTATKTWRLEFDMLNNDMHFRTVMKASHFGLLLFPFTKLKESGSMTITCGLFYEPSEMKVSELGKHPVYQGTFSIETCVDGHFIKGVYSNKAIYSADPETKASDVEYKKRSDMDSLFEDSDMQVNTDIPSDLTDEQKAEMKDWKVMQSLPEAKKQLPPAKLALNPGSKAITEIEDDEEEGVITVTEDMIENVEVESISIQVDSSEVESIQVTAKQVETEAEEPLEEVEKTYSPEDITEELVRSWCSENEVTYAGLSIDLDLGASVIRNALNRGIKDELKEKIANHFNKSIPESEEDNG